jgi:hypothetical protein
VKRPSWITSPASHAPGRDGGHDLIEAHRDTLARLRAEARQQQERRRVPTRNRDLRGGEIVERPQRRVGAADDERPTTGPEGRPAAQYRILVSDARERRHAELRHGQRVATQHSAFVERLDVGQLRHEGEAGARHGRMAGTPEREGVIGARREAERDLTYRAQPT